MNAPISRRALQLLPPCATTGIGSLPHSQLELALQMAFQVDIPYVPQLPSSDPSEFMIPGALDGLPGLRFDAEGLCSVDIDEWQKQREAFGASIESALSSGDLKAFEPSPRACRAWKPFLWEVANRKLAFAKAQIAGPATVRWATKTSVGTAVSNVADLDQQILRLLLAKSLAMAKAVRRAAATPIGIYCSISASISSRWTSDCRSMRYWRSPRRSSGSWHPARHSALGLSPPTSQRRFRFRSWSTQSKLRSSQRWGAVAPAT